MLHGNVDCGIYCLFYGTIHNCMCMTVLFLLNFKFILILKLPAALCARITRGTLANIQLQ